VKKETRGEGSFVSSGSLTSLICRTITIGRTAPYRGIYALGACAMDEGITGRRLVKDVEAHSR